MRPPCASMMRRATGSMRPEPRATRRTARARRAFGVERGERVLVADLDLEPGGSAAGAHQRRVADELAGSDLMTDDSACVRRTGSASIGADSPSSGGRREPRDPARLAGFHRVAQRLVEVGRVP